MLRDRTPRVKELFPCRRRAGGGARRGLVPSPSVEHPVRPTLRRASGRRLAVLLVGAVLGAVVTVAIAAWTATDEPADQAAAAAANAEPLPGRPALLVLPLPETAGLTGERRRSAVEDAARSRPEDVEAQLALVGGRPGVRAARGRRGGAGARGGDRAGRPARGGGAADARLRPGEPAGDDRRPRDARGAASRRRPGALPAWRRAALGRSRRHRPEHARRPAHARGRGHLRDGGRRPPAPGHGARLPAVLHVVRPRRRLHRAAAGHRRGAGDGREGAAPARRRARRRRPPQRRRRLVRARPHPRPARRWRRRSRAR